MKIKICGIRSLDDIEMMNEYHPDFIGFIFFPKSKRYVTPNQAKELKSNLNSEIKTVGVFVDENISTVTDYFNHGIIDLVQLHGNESQEYIKTLQNLNIPVIKAIRIQNGKDFESLNEFNPDFFLFDVKSDKFIGGTGESFNWSSLSKYDKNIPYFLAGGVNKNNLKEAFNTKASVLDISSGVETNFKKDRLKIEELFNLYNELN